MSEFEETRVVAGKRESERASTRVIEKFRETNLKQQLH